jgi:hypothetical protein
MRRCQKNNSFVVLLILLFGDILSTIFSFFEVRKDQHVEKYIFVSAMPLSVDPKPSVKAGSTTSYPSVHPL